MANMQKMGWVGQAHRAAQKSPSVSQWRDGFTLIEILVTLAMVSVLFVMLYQVFRITTTSIEDVEETAELYRMGRGAVMAITRDLSMALPPSPLRFGSDPTWVFEGIDRTHATLAGEYPSDHLRFVSLSHLRMQVDAPESDRNEVQYLLDQDRLVRKVTLESGLQRMDPIGEGILGLNFRYWMSGQWEEAWPVDPKQCPDAIEIEILMRLPERRFRLLKGHGSVDIGSAPWVVRTVESVCQWVRS